MRKYSPIYLTLFAIALLFIMKGMDAAWQEYADGAPLLPVHWVLAGLQLIGIIYTVRSHISMHRRGYRFEYVRIVPRIEEAGENELERDVLTDPGESYMDEGTHDGVSGKDLTGRKRVYYQG